jgi:hypothetical protein
LAAQPAATVVALDTKTNVKQPLVALELNVGGIVVPEKAPNSVAEALSPS